MRDETLCNDNNKCTNDVCHPKLGCLNTMIKCDDKNECTTETCDPVVGCIYKHKNCDDQIFCTRDSCIPSNGTCVSTFDKSISPKCKGGPCSKTQDCAEYEKFHQLSNSCQKAVCDLQLGTCVAIKINKCAENCKRSCFPNDRCDQAKCVLNEKTSEFECIHKKKNCDDNKSCTLDSCDPQLGCVHKISELCPAHPLCDTDADCISWERSEKLKEKCQRASCDVQKGICVKSNSETFCGFEECSIHCKPSNQCESAQCLKDSNGKAYCSRTPIICDDKKECTDDKCDPLRGCVFNYKVSEKCKPGLQCEKNCDCQMWEKQKNLKEKCRKAVCDIKLGSCKSIPIDSECERIIDKCQDNCLPRNKCDKAQCVKDLETNEVYCKHTPKSCDDGKTCTEDSCDKELGCVHKYTVSEECPLGGECNGDNDCIKFAFDRELSKKCLKSICDKGRGACIVIPKDRPCIDRSTCEKSCVASNPCETSGCSVNCKGDYVCIRKQKVCNDHKHCTYDYCDISTGKCVNSFVNSANCSLKCNVDLDCAAWGENKNLAKDCLVASCDNDLGSCVAIPSKDKKCLIMKKCLNNCSPRHHCETSKCTYDEIKQESKCEYFPKVCFDGKKCTIDTCNNETGCVFSYQVSKNCPANSKCEKQSDCYDWAIKNKLNDNCEEAKCDEEYGKCVAIPSQDKTCVSKRVCEKDCKPSSACETVACVKNEKNIVQCIRNVNSCDDKKVCTKDSCDKTTGKCLNIYTESELCPANASCERNLDCKQWGIDRKLDVCQDAVCDSTLGACRIVPNGKKCSASTCKKGCIISNKCEEPVCSYDIQNKLLCEYKRKDCDDGKKCTVDMCDTNEGCIHKFDKNIVGCDTPVCEHRDNCNEWANKQNLNELCQEAICNPETGTCKAVLINNAQCNPYLNKCKRDCKPSSACETALCIVDGVSKQYSCERKKISCDDGNECTKDVCDPIKGCIFTYKESETCPKYCTNNADCIEYGNSMSASLNCQIAVCDLKKTSCTLEKDTNPKCKDISRICSLVCKPKNDCDVAQCERKSANSNKIECLHTPKSCDDSKSCTVDSCDIKTGCKNEFKFSDICVKPCDKDLDCSSWGVTNKLEDKCELAVCDKDSGSCKAVKGPQTPKCKNNNQCETSNDCPQGKYGSICCQESSTKKCCDNQCREDSDCVSNNDNVWGYCVKEDTGKMACKYKDKCKLNTDCDDNNPCTKDICLSDYGFCRHQPLCTDNTECTSDICIPSKDGKSYKCENRRISCTTDPSLLDRNFELLSKADQTNWLGKCSNVDGCITCTVNAQCEDNNGCTKDSCENKLCVHKPIDNKWCDPKLLGQPLKIQGYFGTTTKN